MKIGHRRARKTPRAVGSECWTLTVAVLLSALVSGVPVVAAGADQVTADNVAARIESASTAADHDALAAYFRSEAAANADKVTSHEAMLDRFKKRGGKPAVSWMTHCTSLIRSYRAAQENAEKLAQEHERMAKEAGRRR